MQVSSDLAEHERFSSRLSNQRDVEDGEELSNTAGDIISLSSDNRKEGKSLCDSSEGSEVEDGQTLPTELIVTIAEFLAGSFAFGSLAQLNLVSKSIHEETLPVLYETMTWDHKPERSWWNYQGVHFPKAWRYCKYLVMMEKSLPPFRRFLRNNVIKLEGNWTNWTHHAGSATTQYAIGHWQSAERSDDGSVDVDDEEEGILPGGWPRRDSQGTENVGDKEDDHREDYAQYAVGNWEQHDERSNDGSMPAVNDERILPGGWPHRNGQGIENVGDEEYDPKDDYARLECIFPRLTMLISKKIDHFDIDRPRIQSHVTLFKPIAAFHLISAAVNAVYCRHTTFCGAIFQNAYNPLNCRPVLEEQLTQLSIMSKGRIIQAPSPHREDSHRLIEILKRRWDPDFATEREPKFALSVLHFKHDVAPAIRSDMLEETLRNLLGVVFTCPILLADRLRLEINGCNVDDLDTLSPLISYLPRRPMNLTVTTLPNDVVRFRNQLRTIADQYAAGWHKIGFNGPKSVFFKCYYGEDLEGHSDDGEDEWRDEWRVDNIIVGTLSTLDFAASGRRSARMRQQEELGVFELRIERIAQELWVRRRPLEDDDIELLSQQTYSARSA